MDFRILGPLEVRSSDGAEIPVAPHQAAALCVLALSVGAPVSPQLLAAALWGDDLPGDPAEALRTRVHRLRRALAPHERVHTHPAGYMLKLEEHDSLDVQNFRALAAVGQQHLTAGRPAAAADVLTEALSLWREPALASFPATPSMNAEAALLAEQRLAAQDSLADAQLALGQHQQLTAHLRAVVDRHPAREHTWAQLMLALYRCGDRAGALAAYQAARAGLAAEYGIDPGPALQKLQRQILACDPVLTLPARPPASIQDTPPTGASPAAGQWNLVRQLPPAITDFTGRQKDTEALLAMIGTPGERTGVPIAVISGLPGVGKSSLALHVAHQLAGSFPDGQLWLELAGSSPNPHDPAQVLAEALRALGVPGGQIPATLSERAALYRSRLAGTRVLVVIDDAGTALQVKPLLPGTSGCAAVVTSRAQLGDLPGTALLPLEPLSRDDAVEMLARIAGPARIAAEPGAAADLVAACGLLPLAIRICAAKLAARPDWPLSVLAAHLADQRKRLDELVIGDSGVRAAIGLSYFALDERARRALRRLAVAGAHDVAEWVFGALLDEPSATGVADTLVGRSLLMALGADATGEPRYRLHDLLRDYAAEQLHDEPPADVTAAHARMVTGLLELADLADTASPMISLFLQRPRLPGRVIIPEATAKRLTADPLAWFAAEQANLAAATEWACAVGNHEQAAQLAACQSTWLFLQGADTEAGGLWRLVIDAAAAAGDHAAEARAGLGLASTCLLGGQLTRTVALLDQYLPVLTDLDGPATLARAQYWRAFCAAEQEQFGIAHHHSTRALGLARLISDRPAEAQCLRVLGQALAHLGRPGEAVTRCEEALAMAREYGVPGDKVFAKYTLASVLAHIGQPQRAAEICLRELERAAQFPYAATEAYFRDTLGAAYDGLGRHEDAIAEYCHAIRLYDEHGARAYGAPLARAKTLYHLAHSYEALGHHARAQECLEESLPILREAGFALPRPADSSPAGQ